MACTARSAVEYVKTARVHLVRELTNLSVIVENLYQQNVFSDEEVSKIKAERDDYDKSRAILDSVIKKGEAACYEFLRILDTTRKRSLDRRPLLPEKKSKASHEANKFDLHHWISCFSFKDEAQMDIDYLQAPRPCHRYQAKLKSKAQKISGAFWMQNEGVFKNNRKPNLSYASLVLDTQGSISTSKIKKLKSKKSKMIRSKKMRTYVPEDRPEISPSGLLKSDKDILMVGKPGIGKTALCHEMLKLWAETDSRELDYMFYFDMRETSHFTMVRSLEDLLFSVFSEPDEGKEEVLQDMKQNSDNVTIIFDNVTDVSSSVVQKLVEKDLLPDAKLILTCRPDDDDEDFFGDFLRVEVKGFSEQTIKTYLSAVLGEQHEKVLSSVELLTLCHVPMYALMVAACLSFEAPEDSPQPCSITEVYISIVRFCLLMNSNKTKIQHLNSFITNKRQEILSLAEAAFHATERKTVILPGVTCADSCVLSFLKPLVISVACTEKRTLYAFLHYTMQEFFAALWLLKNPDKIQDVLQQCLTEEKKHMKHLIPFMCRLLTDKNPSLMKCLTPDQELTNTSEWFLKEMLSRFLRCQSHRGEDSGLDVDIVFLCQCLFESQCPEACVDFLNKLNHRVDLSGQSLESYPCCAVAYVVAQSNKRKVWLNLEDAVVSERGVRRLFGCLHNVHWCDALRRQLWEVLLLSGGQVDGIRLLGLDRNRLHLPVGGKRQLFERAARFMQKNTTQVQVCLHWKNSTRVSQGLVEFLLEALPHISTLSFSVSSWSGVSDAAEFLVNLFCAAAEREQQTGEKILELLSSVCSYESFPFRDVDNYYDEEEDYFYRFDFLLDLFSRLKEKEAETGLSVLPLLQSVFQSAPAVWIINLSERKTSILLEVLRLQPEKKQVKLRGCTGDQSEVRSLLQCLPYISQLSVCSWFGFSGLAELVVNLFCAAAEREQQTGEKILELLSSVCSYESFPFRDVDNYYDFHRSDVLLDLFSRLKEKEAEKGFSVLPSLQSVFQSAPAVWIINLSERKTSILLEVLRLQPEKKRVELRGCTGDQSAVRSLLQCLPYISQLSVCSWSGVSDAAELLVNLFCAAAEREQQTGEKILELLSSVCSYESFPLRDVDYDDDFDQSDFLLDLFSRLKEKEAETGFSVLPSLQSVFQSAPAVWIIDLSQRKTSILLEVLRLQPEKKRVELRGRTGDQSEVRSLLQCLPYISQLGVCSWSGVSDAAELLVNLFCAAAEREQQTGEKILELLSSVCSHKSFPFRDTRHVSEQHQSDVLLDLFSRLKEKEAETGFSVLPSLQSVFQSAPAVWIIDLSQRKTSILLEVLRLQPEKKRVELRGRTGDQSEVRSLLQCLPYISQLGLYSWSGFSDAAELLVNLFCAAAEREQQTGEKILELLSSVCSYESFPLRDVDYDDDFDQSDFLLDLFSRLKEKEAETGFSVLPSLQSVFQSAPAVWIIDLSQRKTSILLEVLRLQPEKKRVELRGRTGDQSEVRSLLQCLPYISQLGVCSWSGVSDAAELLVNLFCAAAEREQQTGEKILELLSSVCSYESFPLRDVDYDDDFDQSDFLLDLFSRLKEKEAETGFSVLPSLQSVFQSAPAVWIIDLSQRKTSILLEVLRLQSEKKQVELRGCTGDQSAVRSLLQCLPYISQLRLSQKSFQQLLSLLHEIQDRDWTRSLLSALGGDLSRYRLSWEDLLYLLQQSSAQTLTVNLRNTHLFQESVPHVFPFLNRIVFKRPCPGFVFAAITEIYRARAGSIIPSLLRSLDHEINLTCRKMDSVSCAALLFTLKHSDRVKLKLLWTSIPTEEVESILFTLDNVSQLSVDRNLLLRFIHCCAAPDGLQGAAAGLLRTVQHRLDLSCSSCVELPEEEQSETLRLTSDDCRAVSTILRHSSRDTQLHLHDCEVEDGGLDLLFPALDRVRLRASTAVLLQLVSLVPGSSERDSVRRAASLCRALGGELDFSHTTLDQRTCAALSLMLDVSEGLTELDLSHCELTDQLLSTFITHLHKVQVLDVSHNRITDASSRLLLQLVSIHPSMDSVRLFGNKIVDKTPFKTYEQFEIW